MSSTILGGCWVRSGMVDPHSCLDGVGAGAELGNNSRYLLINAGKIDSPSPCHRDQNTPCLIRIIIPLIALLLYANVYTTS